VRDRAGNRCEYCLLCQRHCAFVLQIEHVLSRKHGGSDDILNLALACDRCNAHKGSDLTGIDPDTGQLVPLFNPRTQTWTEHFAFGGSLIVGLTPTGRTTVGLLQMNAPRRLRLRAKLLERGDLYLP